MKKPYLTLRSRYYFRNLSTTAAGGEHCALRTELRERSYTHHAKSEIDGQKGAKFLRKLLAQITQAKIEFDARFAEHIRGLKGYEHLYEKNPPHFTQKTKELVFQSEIVKQVADATVPYSDLEFMFKK